MSTALRLYEIPAALAALDARVEDADGELSPELEAEFDALIGSLEDRAAAVAALAVQHERTADAVAAEADRLGRLAGLHRRAGTRLKRYLRDQLVAANCPRLDAGPFRLRVQANPAAIRWEGDPDTIPGPYRRVRVELDGDAARRALAAGTLPEAFIVTRGSHLRIS